MWQMITDIDIPFCPTAYGGHVDEDATFACMKAAYDSGVNFFDCAEGTKPTFLVELPVVH